MDKTILKKACSFCIYQERTQQEMRTKLLQWKVNEEQTEEIIAWLINENFINEERFAKTYAGSKFRVKNWGRNKIKFSLKSKGLSNYCIESGLKEIEAEDYIKTMQNLIEKKDNQFLEANHLIKKQKIMNYLLAKGFEIDEILKLL